MENTEKMNLSENMSQIQLLVFSGLLFAVAIILSLVENMIPLPPMAVPGVKYGLSNIVVMYALFMVGVRQAYAIAILKSLFVFLTRGLIAGALSLSGGLLSITLMLVMLWLVKENSSYLGISVVGAVSHNLGQFLVVSLILVGTGIWAYLPVLIVSGIMAGIMTATMLRIILPAMKKLV